MEEKVDVTQEDAEMEAAFAAASGDVNPEPTKTEAAAEIEPKLEEKEDAAAATPEKQDETPAPQVPAPSLSDDQVKLLSAIPKLEQLLQRVDKVDGHYGEIKRLLEETKKASATPQSAAVFEGSNDPDYLDREYEEIAAGVQAKIDKAFSRVPAGIKPEQLDEMLAARETAKRNEMVSALHTMHPDRLEIIKTPEWQRYLDGMPEYKRISILQSQDLYYVSSELSKYKEHIKKQAAQAEKSKQRIESAIPPTGGRATSPSTMSEEEAAQAAFDAQFN